MIERPRAYTLRRRAQTQAETRRRIVEAAVALHGTVGPAWTTLSAIAEAAGVQRHTVYAHFPDEAGLFAACAQHFLANHPPPDVDAWRATRDPRRRAVSALAELYAYYADNRRLIELVLRDSGFAPVGGGFIALQQRAAKALAPSRTTGGAALAAVATSFAAWSVLHESGLQPKAAARVMARLISP